MVCFQHRLPSPSSLCTELKLPIGCWPETYSVFLHKHLRVEVEEGECFPHPLSEDRHKEELARAYLCA